eukprot:jgi/Tetstr1/454037/TSEL_040956.t1
MGVPGYFAAARRACPASVVAARRGASGAGGDVLAVPDFATLYVDFNCVVHNAVGTAAQCGETDDLAVLAHTVRALEHIVDDVSPGDAVYVCADGVPPEAKMAQQRNRRFMAWKRGEAGGPGGAFDRNKITPGTAFNAALDARMPGECERISRRRGVRVHYSGTDAPGEGEQKIMARLRGAEDGAAPACVYGLDADLVLLCACLAAQGHPVPWLCREETDIAAGLMYVDARRLAASMAGGSSSRALWNHVVCSFLCGNDFLPPLSCLDMRRETQWLMRMRVICDTQRLSLVRDDGERLDWPAVGRLVCGLSRTEDEDFARADAAYWSARPPPVATPSEEWDNYPLLHRREGPRAIRPGQTDWRARFYSTLFGMRNASGVHRVAGEYLRGVRWTFDYYRGAFPPPAQPPAWYYRHAYGPTSLDLYNLVASGEGEPPEADISGLDARPVSPGRLLRFVTPRGSSRVLPGDPDQPRSPAHLFPRDCLIATYLRRKIWECRAELPPGCSADVTF